MSLSAAHDRVFNLKRPGGERVQASLKQILLGDFDGDGWDWDGDPVTSFLGAYSAVRLALHLMDDECHQLYNKFANGDGLSNPQDWQDCVLDTVDDLRDFLVDTIDETSPLRFSMDAGTMQDDVSDPACPTRYNQFRAGKEGEASDYASMSEVYGNMYAGLFKKWGASEEEEDEEDDKASKKQDEPGPRTGKPPFFDAPVISSDHVCPACVLAAQQFRMSFAAGSGGKVAGMLSEAVTTLVKGRNGSAFTLSEFVLNNVMHGIKGRPWSLYESQNVTSNPFDLGDCWRSQELRETMWDGGNADAILKSFRWAMGWVGWGVWLDWAKGEKGECSVCGHSGDTFAIGGWLPRKTKSVGFHKLAWGKMEVGKIKKNVPCPTAFTPYMSDHSKKVPTLRFLKTFEIEDMLGLSNRIWSGFPVYKFNKKGDITGVKTEHHPAPAVTSIRGKSSEDRDDQDVLIWTFGIDNTMKGLKGLHIHVTVNVNNLNRLREMEAKFSVKRSHLWGALHGAFNHRDTLCPKDDTINTMYRTVSRDYRSFVDQADPAWEKALRDRALEVFDTYTTSLLRTGNPVVCEAIGKARNRLSFIERK